MCQIPVPFPGPYSTLRTSVAKHSLVPGDPACPACGAHGTLHFTGTWVERNAILLTAAGKTAYRTCSFPVACCELCRHRPRVLSAEFLPYKTYTVPVVEAAGRMYTAPDPSGPGLRRVVAHLGDRHPVHSTLHAWLAGLGERALDRLPRRPRPQRPRRPMPSARPPLTPAPKPPPAPTAAALIVESARRLNASLRTLWQQSPSIPRWKYRSERRREQLEACARVFAAASILFPNSPAPLVAWQAALATFFGVAGWTFPTGPGHMPIEQTASTPPRVDSARRPEPPVGDASHAPRSPPHRRLSP